MKIDDEIGVDLLTEEEINLHEITDADSPIGKPTIPTLISTTNRLPLTSLQV